MNTLTQARAAATSPAAAPYLRQLTAPASPLRVLLALAATGQQIRDAQTIRVTLALDSADGSQPVLEFSFPLPQLDVEEAEL